MKNITLTADKAIIESARIRDASDPRKYAVAEQIVRDALVFGNPCISLQFVQECLNTPCARQRWRSAPRRHEPVSTRC